MGRLSENWKNIDMAVNFVQPYVLENETGISLFVQTS